MKMFNDVINKKWDAAMKENQEWKAQIVPLVDPVCRLCSRLYSMSWILLSRNLKEKLAMSGLHSSYSIVHWEMNLI